jgi:hypothetical protein
MLAGTAICNEAPKMEIPMDGGTMASWVLECKQCHKIFHYVEIQDKLVNMFIAEKPEFPEGGLEIQCPHCREKSTYKHQQLFYQA